MYAMNLQTPVCANEAQIQAALLDPKRLAAVRDSGLLDSPPEESFDRLTRLAAKLTSAPVTFVSLVDAGRDFYKSAMGFGEPLSTARQLSGRTFCHHALVAKEALILEDVTQLPVFRDVPTVDSLGIRAYAGIPLKTEEGEVLGSFCAVDFKPRKWTEWEVDILVELAHSTMREIRLRKALHDAEGLNQELLAHVERMDGLNRALGEMANTDPLTRLSNRRAFDHRLQVELALVARRSTPLSLLMLDVDHFKQINDTFGHDAGDKVLEAIARTLSSNARVIDIVARVGGEEFAVILPNTDAQNAQQVAERMRLAVAQSSELVQPTTVSIGAATLQGDEDALSLYSRADAAMYTAKKSGRNCVVGT